MGDSYKLLYEKIEDKQNIIIHQEEIIQMLKQQIEELKKTNEENVKNRSDFPSLPRYSDAVVRKNTEEILLVKPKKST